MESMANGSDSGRLHGMEDARFPLGRIVATHGAKALAERNGAGGTCLLLCIAVQHAHGHWGSLCEEDREVQEEILRGEADGPLMSEWEVNGQKLWVITEWDRSVTTFLLPEEYR